LIAVGAILADELVDILIAVAVSQIPAIISYVMENEDKVKEDIERFIISLGRIF